MHWKTKIQISRDVKNNHKKITEVKYQQTVSSSDTSLENNLSIFNVKSSEHKGIRGKNNQVFNTWSFGTINIRSGKEKDEGAKIYLKTKEVANAGFKFLLPSTNAH